MGMDSLVPGIWLSKTQQQAESLKCGVQKLMDEMNKWWPANQRNEQRAWWIVRRGNKKEPQRDDHMHKQLKVSVEQKGDYGSLMIYFGGKAGQDQWEHWLTDWIRFMRKKTDGFINMWIEQRLTEIRTRLEALYHFCKRIITLLMAGDAWVLTHYVSMHIARWIYITIAHELLHIRLLRLNMLLMVRADNP